MAASCPSSLNPTCMDWGQAGTSAACAAAGTRLGRRARGGVGRPACLPPLRPRAPLAPLAQRSARLVVCEEGVALPRDLHIFIPVLL